MGCSGVNREDYWRQCRLNVSKRPPVDRHVGVLPPASAQLHLERSQTGCWTVAPKRRGSGAGRGACEDEATPGKLLSRALRICFDCMPPVIESYGNGRMCQQRERGWNYHMRVCCEILSTLTSVSFRRILCRPEIIC